MSNRKAIKFLLRNFLIHFKYLHISYTFQVLTFLTHSYTFQVLHLEIATCLLMATVENNADREWEDPLEKGMATHSSILAWIIPWTEESGGLQSMGSHMTEWVTHTHIQNISINSESFIEQCSSTGKVQFLLRWCLFHFPCLSQILFDLYSIQKFLFRLQWGDRNDIYSLVFNNWKVGKIHEIHFEILGTGEEAGQKLTSEKSKMKRSEFYDWPSLCPVTVPKPTLKEMIQKFL